MSANNSHQSEETKTNLLSASAETQDSLRAQIRELHDKLIFANETIAMMEDELEAKRAARQGSYMRRQSEDDRDEQARNDASDNGDDDEASAQIVG